MGEVNEDETSHDRSVRRPRRLFWRCNDYDNFPNWDGNITGAWFGQAQRFVVPNVDNILVDWRSEFASEMGGLPVNFSIRDEVAGIPGGASYYSNTVNVPGGGGIVSFTNIDATLISGQNYMAVWDFLGYSGQSIHFTAVDVVPGNGLWKDQSGVWTDFAGLDQKLTARFVNVVPEPASKIALTSGLALLIRRRRR